MLWCLKFPRQHSRQPFISEYGQKTPISCFSNSERVIREDLYNKLHRTLMDASGTEANLKVGQCSLSLSWGFVSHWSARCLLHSPYGLRHVRLVIVSHIMNLFLLIGRRGINETTWQDKNQLTNLKIYCKNLPLNAATYR